MEQVAPAGPLGPFIEVATAMVLQERVTAAMIAERLNLSRSTVSAVLSGRAERHRIADRTAKRILLAAEKLNYRPNVAARLLTGHRSNSVGVFITSEMMIDLRLIEAMEIIASARGIRFIVGHALGSPAHLREYLADFRSRGVDGVFSIFHHHPAHRDALIPELLKFRNVVFYEPPAGLSTGQLERVCYAGPDFTEVGRLGVQRLIDQGRRRIGMYLREMLFPYAQQRRRAYEESLRHAGLEVNDGLVWVMSDRTNHKWTDTPTPEIALRVVDDLVEGQGVDAIIAVNDLYAVSVVAALQKKGYRVPEDVAVVGCDNLDFGVFTHPSITTIDLQLEELARALVTMMFDLLENREIPSSQRGVLVAPRLIERASG